MKQPQKIKAPAATEEIAPAATEDKAPAATEEKAPAKKKAEDKAEEKPKKKPKKNLLRSPVQVKAPKEKVERLLQNPSLDLASRKAKVIPLQQGSICSDSPALHVP